MSYNVGTIESMKIDGMPNTENDHMQMLTHNNSSVSQSWQRQSPIPSFVTFWQKERGNRRTDGWQKTDKHRERKQRKQFSEIVQNRNWMKMLSLCSHRCCFTPSSQGDQLSSGQNSAQNVSPKDPNQKPKQRKEVGKEVTFEKGVIFRVEGRVVLFTVCSIGEKGRSLVGCYLSKVLRIRVQTI